MKLFKPSKKLLREDPEQMRYEIVKVGKVILLKQIWYDGDVRFVELTRNIIDELVEKHEKYRIVNFVEAKCDVCHKTINKFVMTKEETLCLDDAKTRGFIL